MRLFRHLFARSARRLFPQARLQRIADVADAGGGRNDKAVADALEGRRTL